MKKQKNLSTKKQFKEAWSYLKESARYIYVCIGSFIASTVFGFINQENLTFLDKFLGELIRQTHGLNALEMIFFILQNNFQSALLSLLVGILFGIFPIMSTITNGLILGYVIAKAAEASSLFVLWRLLPHGIFELPAIFISFGLGIKLGFSLFVLKKRRKEFKRRFYNSINAFLMIIVPLLIIAAIIEGLLIVLVE